MSDDGDNFKVDLPNIIETIIDDHCSNLEVADIIDHGTLLGQRAFTVNIRNITSPWSNWIIYCIAHEVTIARKDGKQIPKLMNIEPISMFEPTSTDVLIRLLKKLNVVLL